MQKANQQVLVEVFKKLTKALLTSPTAWDSRKSRTVFLEERFLDHMGQAPGSSPPVSPLAPTHRLGKGPVNQHCNKFLDDSCLH